ncbi:cytochrome P450 83B1-like [Silene latifolia]|uniref:cytochrome P450 83B1-like n=1 Tax=Silene latifolia TaxID=37657 RepID=UPI003D77DDB7
MFILLCFILITIYLIFFLSKCRRKTLPPFRLPPGPKGLPLIGNLHQFDPFKPHICLAKLGKIYGPISSLRLGNVPFIVVQSAKIAKEILQTQDLNFCSRPSTAGTKRLSYNGLDMACNPYNEYSKEIRKLCAVHLFSSKKVHSFSPIREDEVSKIIQKISSLSHASQVINLSEVMMNYTSSNISRIAFGKSYTDDDEFERRKFNRLLNEAQALFVAFFFADYFPSIGWLDKLTGQASRLEKTFKELDGFYEEIIKDHLHPSKPKYEEEEEDLVDILLRLMKERSFTFDLTLDNIKAVLMDVIVAGTDTSAALVVWAMTELIKNPNIMKKVQEELRNAARNKGYITEDDLTNLEYFKAVVKETFRTHPGAPLLIVRETQQKCTIEGYDILPGTQVFVNVWAIGRDPESWSEPDTFKPERFLGSSIDFKGQDFELIPFGAGRRICPGMLLGLANSELALANMLFSFDWELPNGVKKEDIDTDTLPGVTMHKKNPLCLEARKFSGSV